MTTPRSSESFDRYQERSLSERCACLHQKRQHNYDEDWDGEVLTGRWYACTTPRCPCHNFTEMEES